ncbi:head-tail adaptor protein [Lacibacterium aquatile]|uniref:Head-tail adaptor protein n=1 Tax=Lacibacterium aquatile TaxID=1168082 RepID=A0ABW5DYP4_9PROT
MKTDIGMLRERIVLERASDDPAPGGRIARTYEPLATLWAGLTPVSGTQEHLGQTVGEGAKRPTMRAVIRLTPYLESLGPKRLDTFIHWPRQNRRFQVAGAEERWAGGHFLAIDLIEQGAAS